MNIFDVLSKGERIIVFSSEEDRFIYTWNQSLTLQRWGAFIVKHPNQNGDPFGCVAGSWEEQGHRILGDTPENFAEASEAAQKWHKENE